MASSPSDNFAKTFLPDHPHRRLHVLLSVLAFVIVAGSITLYQMNRVQESYQLRENTFDNNRNDLSQKQRDEVLLNLKESVSKSPPLTDKERGVITGDLKKLIADNN